MPGFDNPLMQTLVPRPSLPGATPERAEGPGLQDRFLDKADKIVTGQVEKSDKFWNTLATVMKEADEKGVDQWSAAYHKRFDKKAARNVGLRFEGKDDDTLRDVEHFLYARDTASLGPVGFLQVAMGTPGHAALKALGLKKGDTSAEEIVRGLQGATVGFSEFLRDQFTRK